MKVYIYCKAYNDTDLEVLTRTAKKFVSEHSLTIYKTVKDHNSLRIKSDKFAAMISDVLLKNLDLLLVGDKAYLNEIEQELISMACNYTGIIIKWL